MPYLYAFGLFPRHTTLTVSASFVTVDFICFVSLLVWSNSKISPNDIPLLIIPTLFSLFWLFLSWHITPIKNHTLWDWITIIIIINGLLSIAFSIFYIDKPFDANNGIYWYFYIQLCINSICFIIITMIFIILHCLGASYCHKSVRFESSNLHTSINDPFKVDMIGTFKNTKYENECCYGIFWWFIKFWNVITMKRCINCCHCNKNKNANNNNNNEKANDLDSIGSTKNIGMCILPGRQKGKFFRDLKSDLFEINNKFSNDSNNNGNNNNEKIILITLCQSHELILCNCQNIPLMVQSMTKENNKEVEILDNTRVDTNVVFKNDDTIDISQSKIGNIHKIYKENENKNNNNFEEKSNQFMIMHCHYPFYDSKYYNKIHENAGWRDKFIPNDMKQFDQFISYFAKMMEKDENIKLVVHCNGGVGRTGTLVCSLILKYFHLTKMNQNNEYFKENKWSIGYWLGVNSLKACYYASAMMRRARKDVMLRNPMQNMFVQTYYNYCCSQK